MRLIRLAPWILLAALVVFTAATYGTLPDDIPQRLGPDGAPTATMAKSVATWFLLPAITLFTVGLLSALSALLPRYPSAFNFPDKARFLRIPAAFQAPVIAEMRAMLDVMSVVLVALFGVVQWTLWRAAHGTSSSGSMALLIAGSVLVLPLILLWLPRLSAATDRAERAWRAADPTGEMAAGGGRR